MEEFHKDIRSLWHPSKSESSANSRVVSYLCNNYTFVPLAASTNNYISYWVSLQSWRPGRVSVSEDEIQLRTRHTNRINLLKLNEVLQTFCNITLALALYLLLKQVICFRDNRTEPVTKRREREIKILPVFLSELTIYLRYIKG